ncbi:acyl-CoA N-acyltransferase [Saccharata proteae CBS 121410]|uniref:Acyl-CoA N-acyltransferase n=1 Tax=Saccharata proteae CBS 121410 TaxID=1314787 RepID=A0A9P4LT85_9PEZI|nr:acyl-CoA N-acyltransferase [Saccharata proteae CBS 121410]
MPLKTTPVLPSDIPTLIRIGYEAFLPGVFSVIYVRAPTPASIAILTRRWERALADPSTRVDKVVDSDTNELLAYARWKLHERERSNGEVEEGLSVPEPVPDMNAEAERAFYEIVYGATREVMGGRRHCYVSLLVTDPRHQRRGAGSLLLKWILRQADAKGLETFLEASQVARPLYERVGFEVVKELPYDLEKYGGKGVDCFAAMLRQPQKVEES